ncbi:uncharacterized protein LOC107266325 isoform X2 [Cephus cinctus]|uniref:Uncharacterized protein LOC107266325 isoform X2 n=1 Tax=Cephus cinctus TaxID=211228 RepID=A0AAJ7BQZ4_CEPCN|nr:uncharacterized protein LOC107266325 isoform X2 [Cephus cinctus]
MSKRYGKLFESSFASSAKKAKLEITVTQLQAQTKTKKYQPSTSKAVQNDDLWGDDFEEGDIEEMDFIATQACSQLQINDEQPRSFKEPEHFNKSPLNNHLNSLPSISYETADKRIPKHDVFQTKSNQNSNIRQNGGSPIPSSYRNGHMRSSDRDMVVPSQKISSSEFRKEFNVHEHTMVFDDFRKNLLDTDNHNSTFQSQNTCVLVSDDLNLKEVERLKEENKKLLDNFITKEGETVFLRHQLQQTQTRAQNEKVEKSKFIEEQASKFRAEINALLKEKENLQTKLQFQSLELGNLLERCKLLESGSVKLTEPHSVNAERSGRNRFNTTINRTSSAIKTAKISEVSVQVNVPDKKNYRLKTTASYFPLSKIPQSLFESSQPEKSVVEIRIVEKIGKRNSPILQDEETFRIFENPDLVKPTITMVDGKRLTVEYFVSDIAAIMKRTFEEINTQATIPIVNKLISVTRELQLNLTLVLQTISREMKNDDIRDMNDLYMSQLYEGVIDYRKTICDADVWHEKERGVEARRALGAMSYVASASFYLAEYIAGKVSMRLINDTSNASYNEQMRSYNAWEKKGCDFEFLEMIRECISVMGLVRRSHQFSGLLCAAAKVLNTVHKRIGFCSKGMNYVAEILKEIVFSRPLPCCYIPMTKLLITFGRSKEFIKKLCKSSANTALTVWKDVPHFTSDACTLEIYVAQLEHCRLDPVATISIAYKLVPFSHYALSSQIISWTVEAPHSCNCCMKLLRLTVTLLCESSRITVPETIDETNSKSDSDDGQYNENLVHNKEGQGQREDEDNMTEHNRRMKKWDWTKLDDSFRRRIRMKQMDSLRKGIQFLCYLATCDPDFIIRQSDVENSFHLFMHRVTSFEGLILHESEKDALNVIRSNFVFDRATLLQGQTQRSRRPFDINTEFEKTTVLSSNSTNRWSQSKVSSQTSTTLYKTIFGI